MNHDAEGTTTRQLRPRPEGLREFSPRAIICGLAVALVMGASYPYVVLKLGFGPNVSVVAAILGYVALGIVFTGLLSLLGVKHRRFNRWENNIVQTAGTAAAQTAFMCILLAAFDMLAQNKAISFNVVLSPLQSFAWLATAGILGVLLAVPLRQHYIVDEKLPFPDGLAAGETILVCDSEGPVALRAALIMIIGMAASALVMTFNRDTHVFKEWGFHSPWLLGPILGVGYLATTGFGVELGLLSIGSGMIIGMRINLCMFAGTLLSWVIMPPVLEYFGILQAPYKKSDVLFWVMWPATGMLVAGGLTALFMRWRVLARTFKNLAATTGSDDFPLRWVVVGIVLSGIGLIVVQYVMLDQPVWITAVAILLSLPLALVGLRVLGETNWGPISALANMMQGIFAILAPGNVPANMVASGTTGTIAVESEAIMQDYKAGDMVGSSPRYLTYMQLIATPVGAAAVAWMYPILRETYGVGDEGLSSPISRKWEGFAVFVSKGLEALPPGASWALLVGVIAGVVLAILESKVRDKTFVPSPTGMGIGMLVPGAVIVTMMIGAIIGYVWDKTNPRTSRLYQTPLASGLIAGEALVAVVVPLLIVLKVLNP